MTLNEQTAMDVIKNQKSKGNIISNETRTQLRVFTEEMSEDAGEK
jgi:hypothetical protein